MKEIRLLAPNGNLGSGYLLSSLEHGLAANPDVIACDSGSTDNGPSYLATGEPYFPRPLYIRDLSHLIRAGLTRRVPVIIGSAAGAGTDPGVNFLADVIREIVRKESLHCRLALIYSDQSKTSILDKLAAHRIRALWPSDDLAPRTVEHAERIVGMMGCEPLVNALDAGADVILAGRASDTSLFAALAVLRGFPPGPAWHAGKILECGAAAAVHRFHPDCMMALVREDHFIVWPPNPEMSCSTVSVAAHTLYENADPYLMREPSGTLVTRECRYEQVDERSVKVSGSQFQEARPYTIKLEGSEFVGFHSIVISGIRDPMIVRHLEPFLAEVRARTERQVAENVGLTTPEYLLNFRVYGRDGVMGRLEPVKEPAHEVGIVFETFAPSQEQANSIVATAHYLALHNRVPQWTGMVTNLATPHSPSVVARGRAFRFSINHTVEPDTPTEMFRTVFEQL